MTKTLVDDPGGRDVAWNSGYATDIAAPWRFPERRALSHPLNGAFVFKVVHRLAN